MNRLRQTGGYTGINPDDILPFNIKTGMRQPIIEVKPRVAAYLKTTATAAPMCKGGLV